MTEHIISCPKCGHQWHGLPCSEIEEGAYHAYVCPCRTSCYNLRK